MEWLSAHHEVLTLLLNLLMLLVWLFYAQLLFGNYRRRRRPSLLVNQGGGKGLDSRCIVSNMSEEAIYVLLVIARVHTSEGCVDADLTDYHGRSHADDQSIKKLTFQGPMKAGEFYEVDSFRGILRRVLRQNGLPDLDSEQAPRLDELALHVVTEYGTDDRPAGACRHFRIQREDGLYRLKPTTALTERLVQRKQRKQMEGWLNRYL